MPKAFKVKTLLSVSTTSASVTGASKEAQESQSIHEGKEVILDWVPCIHYPVQFQKDNRIIIQAIINLGSEVNMMTPAYAKQLGLRTWKTNAEAQKIDGSSLDTFEMVIASFQVINTLGRAWFFWEIFLLADTTMEVVLEIPFLTFSNANIQFAEKELTWRTYTTKDTLSITCQIEIINKKEFAKAALDENVKAFIVHVALFTSKMIIHPARQAQIASLLAEEVTVPAEYADFVDISLKESIQVLPK